MTEIDGMIGKVAGDIRRWLGQLPTASTKRQVKLLELIAVNAEHIVNRIGEELEFEHTLEIFNQHGREAEPPFGGIVVNNGQVLVCNYRTISGRRVDGYVKNKEFITREVEVRKDWPKGERGYEVYDV